MPRLSPIIRDKSGTDVSASHFYQSMKDQKFRAEVGSRVFDIAFRDGRVLVDDEVVSCSFESDVSAHFSLIVEGRSTPVTIEEGSRGDIIVTIAGRRKRVHVKGEKEMLLERYGIADTDAEADHEIRAPMPGLVLSVLVEPGAVVSTGDGLLVLEAMKMENELRATGDGVVSRVYVAPGDAVGKDAILIEFEA